MFTDINKITNMIIKNKYYSIKHNRPIQNIWTLYKPTPCNFQVMKHTIYTYTTMLSQPPAPGANQDQFHTGDATNIIKHVCA